MKQEKKIEAVLFDLDGVLVDACEWHYEALNRALKKISNTEIDRESHITKFNGLPTNVKLKMLGFGGDQLLSIERLKQKYTIEIINEKAQPMKEQIRLLSFLKSEGIKLACVTNSIRETATLMLQKTNQINFFEVLVTNEDIKKNKPQPDCYNLAIDLLHIDPKMTICVEDSEKGALAAINSNASFLWKVADVHDVNYENYLRFINENFNSNGR